MTWLVQKCDMETDRLLELGLVNDEAWSHYWQYVGMQKERWTALCVFRDCLLCSQQTLADENFNVAYSTDCLPISNSHENLFLAGGI